jgi:hypothetical protein
MRACIPNPLLAALFLPTVLAIGTTSTDADTIYVCWDGGGDYLTIQQGIDAAQDGDEVVVCDGTYTGAGNKNLDFHGKAITVRSAGGPESCIIDCQGDGRGFCFLSGETSASVVDGFTVQNGWVSGEYSSGGAILCGSSSPTIANCALIHNTAGVG